MKYGKPTSKQLKELYKAFEFYGSQSALARKVNHTPSSVSLWYCMKVKVPFEVAIKIEKMTKGAVSALALRPDIIKFIKKIDISSISS